MGSSKRHSGEGCEGVWKDAARRLKGILNDETYSQWIAPIHPISMEERKIKLGVSDEYFLSWLQDNFADLIHSALAKSAGRKLEIEYDFGHFSVEEEADSSTGGSAAVEAAADHSAPQKAPRGRASAKHITGCHGRHTFENLVVGPENEFAVAAALNVAKSKGHSPANPLFIYGGTGLGKTHLIQAVAHKAATLHPDSVIEYISCEEFLNLFIDALKSNRPARFRNRFRKADFLLIDDIHFIARSPQLQEEFFNTFNQLHNQDKKIILTSDRRPSEINQLEDRLVSRFDSGLTVDVQPPGVETRLAILRKKQDGHSIKLDDDVLYFVASRITTNVRRLEGALARLITHVSIKGGGMDVDLAERILSAMLDEETASSVISIEDIQKLVASHFDLRVSDLTGSKRPRNIAVPRMIAMYLSRKMTLKSLPEIGAAFDRNHATVVHAVKEIERKRSADDNIKRVVSMFERQLENA